MYKVLKNKRNLYTLLRYRKKALSEIEKYLMNILIDKFSKDFNILKALKQLPNTYFFEYLIIDLQME